MNAPTRLDPRRCAALCSIAALFALACHQFDFSPRHQRGEIDIYDDLFSVSVVDDQRTVAVGYQGAIYWTEDGGDSWHKGRTSTNRLLYSVDMADAEHGWAVGQLGTILRTEDGGRNWALQENLKTGEGTHLFGVQALDARTALAVGEWGGRIYTDDGGATWIDNSLTVGTTHPQFVWLTLEDQEKIRSGGKVYEDVALQDISCLDSGARCWIVGEFGYIFRSDDRGRSWERADILGDVRMDPIALGHNVVEIDEQHAQELSGFAKLVEDETHLNILIDPFLSSREISEFFKGGDPTDLFDIISARIDSARFALEDSGLMSDRLRIYNKPPWDYEDFVEHDPEFLTRYIEGRRADQPMIRVSIIQNPFLFTVRFADEENGLIAGLGGVVLRSEDGGQHWSYIETDRKQALFALESSGSRAVAIGEKGLVRYSEDGGLSWFEPSAERFPTTFTFMRDLGFSGGSDPVGFIVGQSGLVLRSKDGGSSWTQVLPPAKS